MEQKVIRPYSDDQIETHAAKVGGKRNLREVIITDDEGVQYSYLVKRPNRSVVQAAAKAMSNKDVNGGHKIALGCVLEGDMEIIESDGVMFSELVANVQLIGKEITSVVKKL